MDGWTLRDGVNDTGIQDAANKSNPLQCFVNNVNNEQEFSHETWQGYFSFISTGIRISTKLC